MLVGEELSWGCAGIAVSIIANTLGSAPVLIAGDRRAEAQVAPAARSTSRFCARSASPSPTRAPTSRASRPRPCAAATSTSSTGRRPSSPTRATPPGRSSSRRPTRRRAIAASRRSSSRWTRRASRSRSTSRRWASAPPTRPRSRSRTSSCPAANRLGEEGDGFKIAMQTLDPTRPGTAAGAVGVAQAAYELRGRVREAARHVRRADRDAPGRQLPDRRHGDGDRGGAAAHLAGLVDARRGLARDAVLVVREALRRRHRHEGHDRRRAGLRRVRLHQGVPGREAHARREAVPDLRGHVADPAAGDRRRSSCRAASVSAA